MISQVSAIKRGVRIWTMTIWPSNEYPFLLFPRHLSKKLEEIKGKMDTILAFMEFTIQFDQTEYIYKIYIVVYINIYIYHM